MHESVVFAFLFGKWVLYIFDLTRPGAMVRQISKDD